MSLPNIHKAQSRGDGFRAEHLVRMWLIVGGALCIGGMVWLFQIPRSPADGTDSGAQPLYALERAVRYEDEVAGERTIQLENDVELVEVDSSTVTVHESISEDNQPIFAAGRYVVANGVVMTAPPMEEGVNADGSDQVSIDAMETRYFDGKPIRAAYKMRMLTPAYSPDARSCAPFADNITPSGFSVWTNGMKLVAADTKILPFRSIVSIPGYNNGNPVPVLDRGGRIKGHRLDLLYPTHETALEWGAKWLDVVVWEYVE